MNAEWTDECPTVEGTYYRREGAELGGIKYEPNDTAPVVQVLVSALCGKLHWRAADSAFYFLVKKEEGVQWLGPEVSRYGR